MERSILIRPLLVLLTFLIIFALVLMALFGVFGGVDADDSAGGGGESAREQPESEPDRESSEGNLSAADLKVGDCITDANSRTGDVTTFEAVKCDEPHDGEVYTLIRLEGDDDAKVPSEAFINGKGQRGCRARLRRAGHASGLPRQAARLQVRVPHARQLGRGRPRDHLRGDVRDGAQREARATQAVAAARPAAGTPTPCPAPAAAPTAVR